MTSVLQTAAFAALGGVLPPLIWLWFWLKEDAKRPEPKGLVGLAFLSGILAIAPVLFFETEAYGIVQNETLRYIIWAAIEELGKLFVVYILVLRNKEVDEPIDFVIYLITCALGFAALENSLFLWTPLDNGALFDGLITSNLRFIGSTLLHVTASAVIGIAMGFGFYKSQKNKHYFLLLGILLSITLHAAFNLSIINNISNNSFLATSSVWVLVVLILLVIEKIKRVRP